MNVIMINILYASAHIFVLCVMHGNIANNKLSF